MFRYENDLSYFSCSFKLSFKNNFSSDAKSFQEKQENILFNKYQFDEAAGRLEHDIISLSKASMFLVISPRKLHYD